jgi:hypothetical protein
VALELPVEVLARVASLLAPALGLEVVMRFAVLAVAACLLAACGGAAPTSPTPATGGSTDMVVPDNADHGGRSLQAILTGAAEVPGPGDSDGAGTLILSANTGQAEICYALRDVENVDTITGLHIHHGAAGVDGDLLFTLNLPINNYSRGCVDDLDRSVIHDILANPEMYYVNVHTGPYPGGAIRGQLAFKSKPY